MTDPVRLRLDRWKRQLIDLSARNRLLNFKSTRVTTLRIINELPSEVFRYLYLDNRTMRFQPLPEPAQPIAADSPTTAPPGTGMSEFYHVDHAQLNEHHRDVLLQTNLVEEKLYNNLLRIYQSSTSLFVEQGVNVLFLALGMIEWFESRDADTPLQAPVLLLPVQLARQTVRSRFTIKATEHDPILNPAMVEKLRLDFRLDLPKLPDTFEDFDPQEFFGAVQESIASEKRWRITNDIYLGLFTFQKFVMYKDLEINEAHYLDHPIIQSLCAGKGERTGLLPEAITDANLDEAMPPETTYQVLDADSSQQRALLAVKGNYDLVLEGPPGTGKSQTITNLIAEALAMGKHVLFVSEKMAALEVVYSRLQTLGLHDFCLNLHSNKTNKRAVIEELERVLNSERQRDHAEDAQLDRLALLRDGLNDYASELHEPFGALALSPYRIFGELARLDTAPQLNADIVGLADCTQQTFEQTLRDLSEHASLLEEIGDPATHPWRGSELTALSGADRDRVEEAIAQAIRSVDSLIETAQAFAEEIGAARSTTFGQTNALCEIASTLTQSPHTSEAILRDERWNTGSATAKEILEHGRRYATLKAEVLKHFKIELLIPGLSQFNELLQEDFTELLDRYSAYCRSWTRFITPQFWQDRRALLAYYRSDYHPANSEALLQDLRVAHECRAEQLFLRARDGAGGELFGEHWKREESDWDNLNRFAEWIVHIRRFVNEGALESKGIMLAASGQMDDGDVQRKAENLRGIFDEARKAVAEVMQVCVFSDSDDAAFPTWLMSVIRKRMVELQNNVASLRVWTLYQASLKRCRSGIARQALIRFYELHCAAEALEPAFERLFYRRWLDMVCAARPTLGQFRALNHEKRIAEFKQLDLRALSLARQRVLARLSTKRDRLIADSASADELIIVQRELRKKARHLPLRQLLGRAPNAISVIKPCFMMSPLSVAQFLDPAIHRFDLVVFDEASQIPPEDALGAIVRGKQTVVVGDSKQLPPTSFFSAQLTASDDDEMVQNEETVFTDVESILDEFATVGFPRLRLLWHYRSQHESLITFSNRKFYESELITFPSPATGAESSGVQFQWVGGVYEGKGANPVEARAVADAVCDHIHKTPHLSLGVGTFNLKQQTLILDELDRRRREDPSLEFFFAHKGEQQFFVKNLENIQGDDRDVIFISVTYGPDADGRVRYNFGPLNGPNGGRRLNVILTRAKQTLKVFTSLRGDQIDPTRAQSEGARLLREYLLFAERGTLSAPVVDAGAEIESPFEQSVYEALTQRGIRLVPQVGQSGYRIDFGVLDDAMPGRFVAGIECDGASYHSAATARDRDRLRQEVLEKLGWHIHRIWSTDWYHDKDSQIARILKLIDASRDAARHDAEVRQSQPITSTPDSDRPEVEDSSNDHDAEVSQEAMPAPQTPASETRRTTKSATGNGGDGSTQLAASVAKITPYKLTPVQVIGSPEGFNIATDAEIGETLQRIVDCEAPIHLDEATRRVAAHWQIARVGAPIRARVEGIASALAEGGAIRLEGHFLWKKNQQKDSVRSRAVGDYEFDAAHICPAEYETAIVSVLRGGPQMMNELTTNVARMLGFERAGRKLTEQISAVIDVMAQRGSLRTVATGIQLAEGKTDARHPAKNPQEDAPL